MQLPAFVPNALGWLAYHFTKLQPFIPTYVHLLASAMFPIYAGAHSSLSRPSSAAKPVKSSKPDGDDAPEEDDVPIRMEGLSPTDALLFPLMAGTTLAGLYFLIKWLQDPAILNKILNWYFATFSVFSVSRLVSDALDVLHSLLFPHEYLDGGILYHVDARTQRAIPASSNSSSSRKTPLPGFLSRLQLPDHLTHFFWILHVLPNRRLTFNAFLRGFGPVKANLGIHGIEGLTIGLASVVYYNFVSKPWWLTNLMGFGFAYGSLQLLSPTTFWTGTLILSGLFFYDIYFVFYTPMMVTVAKSLDIPIKLLFPRPPEPDADPASRAMSMLGLGDVVLPGIMIGLALRFDLYMFYLRKQTKTMPKSSTTANPDDVSAPKSGSRDLSVEISPATQLSSNTSEVSSMQLVDDHASVRKSPYQSVAEGWGDRLWTLSLLARPKEGYTPRGMFPKPYFHASLFGYFVGMLATLGAMQIFNHAQPALLYLVPGVLSSLWLTAVLRSEVHHMWNFSDAAGDEDASEQKRGEEKHGTEQEPANEGSFWEQLLTVKSFFSNSRSEERAKTLEQFTAKHVKHAKDDNTSSKTKSDSEKENVQHKTDAHGGTLFSLSIVAPELFPQPRAEKTHSDTGLETPLSLKESATNSSNDVVAAPSTRELSENSREESETDGKDMSDTEAPRWNPSKRLNTPEEHSGKRQRLQ